jgi:DNA-directed RNA polymerase specialized sigma subunit
LLTGIDKYCGEFSKVWRGVAVGRITGLLIYGYSQTMLYFFPKDRRKLYRANKDIARAIRNKESVDYNELARSVSEHVATTPSELHELVAGASMLSCDSVAESADGENEGVSVYSKVSAPTSCQPDVQVEKKELHSKLQAGIATLSLRLRKVLKMRGI